MAINLNSFVWASMGIEPPQPEDAIYVAGEQPIAGFDNHAMWAVTDDLKRLRDWTASHGSVHEAGGNQEINLKGLSVGNVGSLDTDETANEFRFHGPSGSAFVRYDVDDDLVRDFPTFGIRSQHREGIETGNDIIRQDNTVIYDHADDYFHRAREADHASTADVAGDSDMVDGKHADAFVEPHEDIQFTGIVGFTEDVDADILGNAATADHADEADHALTADQADLALDSNHLEGNTTQDILDMVEAGVIPEYAVDIEDNGTEVLADAKRLNFDENIDVSAAGGTATMSVDAVNHSQTAEYAYNSDKVDNYHVQEIIDEAETVMDPKLVDIRDNGTEIVENADAISFDQSIDVTEKAPGIAGVSVDSVPHAQNAEYAYNSDKVDNMHAQEIIDAALSQGGGADGRWSYIDDWQVGGTNTPVDWDVNVRDEYNNVYDIYKLVLVHENYSSYEGWDWFKFWLNFDFRFRYSFSSHTRASSSSSVSNVSVSTSTYTSIDISHSLKLELGWGYWPICPTKPGQRAVAEYKIANPTPMSTQVENRPHIAAEHYSGSPDANRILNRGKLDTDFDELYAFSIETDHPAQSYIQLWGTDLDIVGP